MNVTISAKEHYLLEGHVREVLRIPVTTFHRFQALRCDTGLRIIRMATTRRSNLEAYGDIAKAVGRNKICQLPRDS